MQLYLVQSLAMALVDHQCQLSSLWVMSEMKAMADSLSHDHHIPDATLSHLLLHHLSCASPNLLQGDLQGAESALEHRVIVGTRTEHAQYWH